MPNPCLLVFSHACIIFFLGQNLLKYNYFFQISIGGIPIPNMIIEYQNHVFRLYLIFWDKKIKYHIWYSNTIVKPSRGVKGLNMSLVIRETSIILVSHLHFCTSF